MSDRRLWSLDTAVELATAAHRGQTDKAGEPYIGHPLRVMARVTTEHEKMAAVLHDVLEDTDVTADDLRAAGCPDEVITAVEALTKAPGEPLVDSIARAARDPIARVVKHADVLDNTDPRRAARLDPETRARLAVKYEQTLRILGVPPAGQA